MKAKTNSFPTLTIMILALTVLVACGKQSAEEEDDGFLAQAARMGDDLMAQPAPTNTGTYTNSLSGLIATAYPAARAIYLPNAASFSPGANARGLVTDVTPGGIPYFLNNGYYYNGYGQQINFGVGGANGPYGGFARWGAGVNTANGNSIRGGIAYIPGAGLGVVVQGCSSTGGYCRSGVAAFGYYGGSFLASCYNGVCTRY